MRKKYSSTFIKVDNKKYLNFSTSIDGYDMGYHHPFFTQRAKNYLKLQTPDSHPFEGEKHQFEFFYKYIPWLSNFPHLYMVSDAFDFLKQQNISFGNVNFFHPTLEKQYSQLITNGHYSFSSPLMHRFNGNQADVLFLNSLLHLKQMETPSAKVVCLSPALSLSFPVKSLIFSKIDLQSPFKSCETSRQLYRDFFHFTQNKAITQNILTSCAFLEKDLEKNAGLVQSVSKSDNLYHVVLKSPVQNASAFYTTGLSRNENHLFLGDGTSLFLGIPYVNNPKIFDKKLGKLLLNIV